jgi:Ca2+-transporting ATPase
MVTGDYAATAEAIGREIGILRPEGRVISGQTLEEMSDEQLQEEISGIDVFARVAPNHKSANRRGAPCPRSRCGDDRRRCE